MASPERFYGEGEQRAIVAEAKLIGRVAAREKYRLLEPRLRRWINKFGPEDQATADTWAAVGQRMATEASLHSPALFLDKKSTSIDIWEVLRAAGEAQSIAQGVDPGQYETTVEIKTKDPIVLVPTGDWHMGSYASDHTEIERNLRLVFDTPHLYMIDLGDTIDNFTQFKSLAPVLNQVIPPAIQKEWLTEVLRQLVEKGKLIARAWSNHVEEFDERAFGGQIQNFNKLCPYLKADGRLTLKVGDSIYKIWASHVSPGKSIYHVNHGNKRFARFTWQDADMYISGHTHDGPEHEVFIMNERPRLAMKVPTAKVWDDHSRRYYGRSLPGLQGIVLMPDQLKFVPFYHVEDAIGYRGSLASL